MTPEPSPQPRRGLSLSDAGSAIALVVSVSALALGAYQTRLMQEQARAGVWPYLSIGYTYSSNVDKDAFIWTVNNNGVGPAKVESVEVSLDGKPVRDWKETLALLGSTDPSPSIATSSIGGEVIPPNTNRETTVAPIRVNDRAIAKLFKDAEHRFGMDICYCSVYDDCWIAHWQKPAADPVERCENPGDAGFRQ
ncbi:MAG TPA: hypothetical protein VHE32_12795 [Rhodanobacteraceae bacterium]|jgi:hypothetical protein|nr:hypothetical protein [Rhodanobacteraceae bacterium]